MKEHATRYFSLILFCLFITGCKTDRHDMEAGFVVTVRIPNDPDRLNPARATGGIATQLQGHLFYPLAEIDPFDYTLSPLLVKSIPAPESITGGPFAGGMRYHYEFRAEAQWPDGVPVTPKDYVFTLNAILNPRVDASQWRGFLAFISDVETYEDRPHEFSVIVQEPYILADLITCNFNIYPAHIYDAEGYLSDFKVRDLSDPQKADSLASSDDRLQRFADAFMDVRYSRDIVVGCGPYRLTSWETGQRIILDRIEDWWGDRVRDKPLFMHAYPERIIYEIIPDEQSALTMLKDGRIDLISEVTPRNFVEMRDDPRLSEYLQFHTPKLIAFNSFQLNLRNPILADKNVRKALAHLVDYEAIIENVTLGMAERTIGPIHPDLPYYNRDIPPIAYDPEEAIRLLAEAGWEDTNRNGVLDKVIDGQRTELALTITVTQRAEGQSLALLLKESAARAGIRIDIRVTEGAALLEELRARNFDIMPLRMRSEVTLTDPYQNWHSASDAPGGNNRAGFRNAEADALMEKIRTTVSTTERDEAYKALQKILHEELPAIFLYVPLERVIANKRITMQPSSRRPGYFENLFRRAG